MRLVRALLVFAALGLSSCASEDRAAHDYIQDVATNSRVFSLAPTGSMEPCLNERMWMLVSRAPFKDLRIGDIIIWRPVKPWYPLAPGETEFLICHRVWSRSSQGTFVITKGDANQAPDSDLISESMYVGTVVGTIKRPREPEDRH